MYFFSIKQGLHTNTNLVKLLFSTSYDCSLFLHCLGFRLIKKKIARAITHGTITANNILWHWW